MKNIEINSKAVKKLALATLVTLSLGLTGCGNSNENDKPNDKPTNEVNKNEDEIKVVEMSEKETRALTEGQHIEKIDDKTLKVPNREVLEEMGLDYEIVMSSTVTYADGNVKDFGIDDPICSYDLQDISLTPRKSFDENNDTKIIEDYLIGINIIPIVRVFKDDGNDSLYKEVQMEGGVYRTELINPDNLEMLQQMISQKYAYVDQYQGKTLVKSNLI